MTEPRSYPRLKITKLDAASRQLRTAIELWFEDGDPVSIHTLISAAHEITHKLFKLSGHQGLLFDTHVIKDEFRGEFAKLIKSNANFFKHADKDPYKETGFAPIVNECLIFMTLYGISKIDKKLFWDREAAFTTWIAIHKPNLIKENIFDKSVSVKAIEEVRAIGKSDFFKYFISSGMFTPHDPF